MKNGIGSDITAKKTVSGLTAKDREDFEDFVRKRKQTKAEDREEKVADKPTNFEGEPTSSDLTKQRAELSEEKHVFDTQKEDSE